MSAAPDSPPRGDAQADAPADAPAVLHERRGAALWITINRADKRNAINAEVVDGIAAGWRSAMADTEVRAIVLTGSGAKAFCAGGDLHWMRAMADFTWDQNRADAQALADMLWTVYACPVPVIGRIHGDCYAGGVGLAAVCDVLVAAEGMHFCLSEARLGLLPANIAPYVVARMGEANARRTFLTAKRMTAAEARRLGLVSEVVPPDQLDAAVSSRAPASTAVSNAVLTDARIGNLDNIAQAPMRIKAIRRGQITIFPGTYYKDETIPSCDPAKTELRLLGYYGSAGDLVSVELVSATVIRARRSNESNTGLHYVSWELTEYY